MGYLFFYLMVVVLVAIFSLHQNINYAKKKKTIGNVVIKIFTYENYLWIPNILLLIIMVLSILRIPEKQFYDTLDLQTEYIQDLGILILVVLWCYTLIQKTAIHHGGIKNSFGVWTWEEIKSFSLKREGPYQYEHFYTWISKPKYELTFEVLKNPKTEDMKTLTWKVPEKLKNEIYEVITAKIPEKEINAE